MTNEEFQKLVIDQLAELNKGQSELQHSLAKVDSKLDALAAATQDDVTGMLTHIKTKTDQIDDRLESIEDDVNYLGRKSVRFGTEISKLKKGIQVK